MIVDKIQHEITRVIGNGRHIVEYFFQTFFQEPLIRIFLHLNEVGHFQNLVDPRKTHTDIFPEFHRLDIYHLLNHSILPIHSNNLLVKTTKSQGETERYFSVSTILFAL